MFLYASWSLYDTQRVFSGADTTVYETYKPDSPDENSLGFAELQALNPDVLGWVTVYGTGIDYPLVQGETNGSYINTDVQGNFSLSGSIYLDCNCAKDFSDYNTIIHGHHMEKGEMFGDLERFMDESFFHSHEYANLYYDGRNHGVQFFLMIHGDAYDYKLYTTKVADSKREAYLKYLYEKALYSRDIEISSEEHIVLLSTCASGLSNARYILVGKICDKTFADPFPKEKKKVVQRIVEGTEIPFWDILPVWWKYVLAAFAIILLSTITVYGTRTIFRKKPKHLLQDVSEDIEEIIIDDSTDEGGYDENN